MLVFFPNAAAGPNYWANHHVSMAINCGLTAGDAAHAFGPARSVAENGSDASTTAFQNALTAGVLSTVAALEHLADDDQAKGRLLSSADKRFRVVALLDLLDWFFWPWSNQDPSDPGLYFRRARAQYWRAVDQSMPNAQRLSIPFEGVELPALFIPAFGAPTSTPIVIHLNGQHSSMHWHHLIGLPHMLAQRGVASLLFDHPGVGEARYAFGLKVRPDTESYVGAAIDALSTLPQADCQRIGVLGGSLGGYRAPRAAAFEPRIKAAVVWGAHYEMYDSVRIDWPGLGARLPRGGPFDAAEQTVIEGLLFWTGAETLAALDHAICALSLEGLLDRIRAPLLVMHGARDVQLPPWHAERTAAECVNAAKVDLVLFDQPMGGDQHCNWDNPRNAMSFMCDWLRETL